jgi:hypothetical protein
LYFDENNFTSSLLQLENDSLSIFDKIKVVTGLMNKVYFGNQKGYLYFLRGNLYGKLAKEIYVPEEDESEEKLIGM